MARVKPLFCSQGLAAPPLIPPTCCNGIGRQRARRGQLWLRLAHESEEPPQGLGRIKVVLHGGADGRARLLQQHLVVAVGGCRTTRTLPGDAGGRGGA